ncbi:MAG: pseudouridine synthase, RluA family [Verrucomicrobiaceae bacterium]|nr:pseudouridine synthase, RluA family [Verrucomicrobiaceae bacterium]
MLIFIGNLPESGYDARPLMTAITNLAAYKFARLTDLKSLRERLISLCKGWGLKGTILLSTEGVNLFVAGGQAEVEALLAEVHQIPGLETMEFKFSPSDGQPFNRMLVRIKKEIIAFGVEGIDPGTYTSPRLSAKELKQWLDEGRPLTLLDTRNDYEVKLGTFRNAVTIGVDSFRDFPEAVRRLPEHLKNQPIVTFCTGGIRCEKAAPFMEREGFQHIYQLDGGILRYFEECGGAHYDGECFVFDQRVGVDPGLRETESTQCFNCQTPLSAEDQLDARYEAGCTCPYCFKTSEEQMRENIAARHEELRRLTTPLPGSQPYDNHRPLTVPPAHDGAAMIDFLCGILGHVGREEWLHRCEQNRILTEQFVPVGALQVVRSGGRFLQLQPGITEPEVNAGVRLLHEDEAVLVLEKPAPLPMHPCGRFNRHTLQWMLNALYHPQKPRPSHRLDANTTGLIVCARTRHFAGLLQQHQFAQGGVTKVYLVRVQGHPAEDEFVCEAPISDEPGYAGSRSIDEDQGQEARTEFKVLRRDANGTAILEARPITGRTNQIRVHLWQLGHPVVGDQAYLPDRRTGDKQTLDLQDEPLCLHAWRLSFQHPLTKHTMSFETDWPAWAK